MADLVAYNEMMKRSRVEDGACTSGFTPSLPDEVFLNCLVRVPLQWHANLLGVSKSIRALVQSPEYHAQRFTEGASSSFVCMLQPGPSTDAKSPPVFGVTLLDLATGAWERLPAVPGLAGGLPTFAKLVAVERELVVMGGWWQNSWEASQSVFVYNFTSQRWRQGADMPTARSFFACGALGSRVVVAGGHDGDKKALATVECYDVATNSWSQLASMSTERDEPTGVSVNGKFCVVSGYGSNTQGVFSTSGEVYDPASNSWRFVDEMWSPSANPNSLAAIGGELYGVRGKEVMVYNADRNVWTVVGKVPEECEKGEMASTAITSTGNSLVITGLVKKNEVSSLRTLRLTPALGKRKAEWQTIASNEQFLSLAQTSCAFHL